MLKKLLIVVYVQTKKSVYQLMNYYNILAQINIDRPANKEELFNLHHASVWNVIEHIFGVLKYCFQILLLPTKYHMNIQAHIPAVLCALHNFIHIHNMKKILEGKKDHGFEDNVEACSWSGPQGLGNLEDGRVDEDEGIHAVHSFCDQTSQAMWDEYQSILHEGDYVDDGDIFPDDNMDNESDGGPEDNANAE